MSLFTGTCYYHILPCNKAFVLSAPVYCKLRNWEKEEKNKGWKGGYKGISSWEEFILWTVFHSVSTSWKVMTVQ